MNLSRQTLVFLAAWLGALAVTALAYLPGLPGSFVFDDISNIIGNHSLTQPVTGLHDLLRYMLSAPVGGLLRPISTLTFMLDAHLFGIEPEPFKITNICIHLTVGASLWFLSKELLRAYRASIRNPMDDRTIGWLSLAISTLWLVHPLNLTSVLYAVQRDSSLAALFTVTAILSYMVGRRRPGYGGRMLVWLVSPLLTALGVLCKENAALTPVFILVIEYTLLRFRKQDGTASREAGWFSVVFLFMPLLAVVGFVSLRPGFFFSGYDGRGFTMYERVLSEGRVLVDYLRWTFIPDLRQLALFHDDITPSHGLLDPYTTLPSLLAVIGLLGTGLLLRARAALLSFGILWFFAGQLMESTILPLELVFEHRNYLPIFGLIFGIVGTAYPAAMKHGNAISAKALLMVCIILLTLCTAMRAADWQTELTFATSEARHHPHSARASAELQWAYMNYVVRTHDTRLIPLVLDAAEKSKAADPRGINQDVAVAYMYASLGDLPQAKRYLEETVSDVDRAEPSSTLQLALQTLFKMLDAKSAPLFTDVDSIFKHAVRNPRLMSNPCYAADIWNTYGLFQRDNGSIPEALSALHKAVVLCPKVLIRTNLIDLLLVFGDLRDAKPQLDALQDVHDLRYEDLIKELQDRYAGELAAQGKK